MHPNYPTPMKRIARLIALLALVTATMSAASAALINNWVNWTTPSYPDTANTAPESGWWGTTYLYSPTLNGILTMPDSSVVNVTLNGEVIGVPTTSFFSTNVDTGFWNDPVAYISANVATPPQTASRIALAGWGSPLQTLTFSAPVSNITMIITTLGQPGIPATWTFNQPFAILSSGGGGAPLSLSGNGLQLTGQEARGVVQFLGTFTTFSWTVSAPEMFALYNVGVTSAEAPSTAVPEPGTWAAAALLVGVAGLLRWRKRVKVA